MKSERRTTICLALAGDRFGGSHVSLRGLLERLPESLYRVIVVPEIPDGRIADYFRKFEQVADPGALDRPFAVGRTFGIGSVLRTLPGVVGRARLLKDLGVDIVHTNDGRSHASWALAAKLAGARMLWHHRGDPDARGTRLVAPLLSDQIVGVSDYSLPRRRWGKLKRARVIHSPFDVHISVDRGQMRERLIDELQCPEDTIICGYFGQFIARKRPAAFIDAVRALAALADRPVIGVMFGDAEDEAVHALMRERMIADGQQVPVRLMGYREPGHEWIAACDALLVPALNEPLGRTLVEAMLVGTPVIATDSGGNPEALAPDCGILVPPDNPDEMAKATVRLLGSPAACEQMTRRAQIMAKERFSSDNHLDQVRRIYAELVRAPRRADVLSEPGT